jgi:hypothetical protein
MLKTLCGAAPVAKPRQKFYITGLYHTTEFNDCTLPPVECYGTNRLDAIANSGATVWTADEWESKEMEDVRRKVRETCSAHGKERT